MIETIDSCRMSYATGWKWPCAELLAHTTGQFTMHRRSLTIGNRMGVNVTGMLKEIRGHNGLSSGRTICRHLCDVVDAVC